MAVYIARRLINYVFLTFVATSAAYLLAGATLNPEGNYLGRHPTPSIASVDLTLSRYNLNPHTPLLVRYGHWLDGLIHGSLGFTWDGQSINTLIVQRSEVSLRLLLAGTIIGTVAGVALGAWNAVRQYRISDQVSTVLSYLVNSMTIIVIAVLLEQLAIWLNQAVGQNVINFTGDSTPGVTQDAWHSFLDFLSHQAVPTIALVLINTAYISRYQRSVMLDVLGSDFVRTARAKGLRRRTALTKHALRCALIPTATLSSYTVVTMFTGAAITEMIFGWHGMGEGLVTSVSEHDINTVAAIAAFTAVLYLLAGLVSDLLVAVLDPRVRVTNS